MLTRGLLSPRRAVVTHAADSTHARIGQGCWLIEAFDSCYTNMLVVTLVRPTGTATEKNDNHQKHQNRLLYTRYMIVCMSAQQQQLQWCPAAHIVKSHFTHLSELSLDYTNIVDRLAAAAASCSRFHDHRFHSFLFPSVVKRRSIPNVVPAEKKRTTRTRVRRKPSHRVSDCAIAIYWKTPFPLPLLFGMPTVAGALRRSHHAIKKKRRRRHSASDPLAVSGMIRLPTSTLSPIAGTHRRDRENREKWYKQVALTWSVPATSTTSAIAATTTAVVAAAARSIIVKRDVACGYHNKSEKD